ncbi:LANO_0G18316g1_1 [Lachancea nothofagi CBS 11611]|uniref:LANO_0G18316g1_1 n=1 Tax=Lachancea nothofagi CBS 11611 TaxID=1266666 RepID=A0A1G4KKS5_9SACH|nr:LANO_0G18316g1_1 [Lachancea nothofagi CBS 11611]
MVISTSLGTTRLFPIRQGMSFYKAVGNYMIVCTCKFIFFFAG